VSKTIVITIVVPDGVTVDLAASAATPPPEPATEPATRAKVGTTEQLLLDQLASTHGRHVDTIGGRATTQLIDLAGCESVPAAKQALVRLAERGLIEREIKGKRCYRITLTSEGWEVARR